VSCELRVWHELAGCGRLLLLRLSSACAVAGGLGAGASSCMLVTRTGHTGHGAGIERGAIKIERDLVVCARGGGGWRVLAHALDAVLSLLG
jgi:hypothetical protein